VDGVPLVEVAPKRENAKTCPRCKASFDSWTKFCPNDGAPLGEPSQAATAKDPKRTSKNEGDNVAGTIDRTAKRPNAKLKSGSESPATGEKNNSINDGPDESAKFAGTMYVSSLHDSLAGRSIPPRRTGEDKSGRPASSANSPLASASGSDGRDSRQARTDKLAERFRNNRRIPVAVRVRVGNDSMKQQAKLAEAEIDRRLPMSGPRDLDLVSTESLPKSAGWKRVLIDLSINRASETDQKIKMEVTFRDVALLKTPEPVGELGPAESESESPAAREEISGSLIGEPVSQSGPFATVLEGITTEIARRLNLLAESHFDDGQRFVREGNHELALEEFIRYLFATYEFDSPQADEANRYVIASLSFSVLDWLWGESDVAVVESNGPQRRLPLGFRPAPSESANGDLPRTIVCLRDGSEMVLVPAGTQLMGNDSGPADARPAHAVTLSAYYIDRLETSVAQYERFIGAMGHRIPQSDDLKQGSQWDGRAAKKEAAAMPVVHVSWHDARAYAQWAGKSLPSEAQWERAARGGFEPEYPRSVDAAFDRHVNAGRAGGIESSVNATPADSGLGQLVSVYSYSAALNPFGCQSMLGNVAEWCRDWYEPNYYRDTGSTQDPLGPENGEKRVVRGGSWKTPIDQLNSTTRDSQRPTTRAATIGFRCVVNLPES
jgi:formylglycine-generating enzyme required for sulfatase activity